MDDYVLRAFRLLELEPGASRAEAKQAFRDMSLVWHPDRLGQNERLKKRATSRFQDISAAYATVCAWIECEEKDCGPLSPNTEPGEGASEQPDPGEAARMDEAERRRWQPLGPWEGLGLDHAVLRGPGEGQALCVSQVDPWPFIRRAFERDAFDSKLWVTTVAAGPGKWLTAVSRWAQVAGQSIRSVWTVEEKMDFLKEGYQKAFSVTAYDESAKGQRLIVMTEGQRPGSERYSAYSTWPKMAIREARQERDQVVVLSTGACGLWHVATAQVSGWGGQRISLRDSYSGFAEAIKVAWGEGRRITSVGWMDGTWLAVATTLPGWREQAHSHAQDTAQLARTAAEQWSKGRVLSAACHDDLGWLCVWTTHDQWG